MAESSDTKIVIPPPISLEQLEAVPGVLGRIARERYEDYLDAELSPLVASDQHSPGFGKALSGPGLAIIAEIKRASPSQGEIAALDPADAAIAYRAGGASALSVLTESRHFGGELEHIGLVREAVELPILRKDFTVHPQQLIEARNVGASAVLLIVALCGAQTGDYLGYARALGLDVLVEVHDEWEMEIALQADAGIIGVNNRDLTTLEIDLETAPHLLRMARNAGYRGLLVAESGYRERDEVLPLVDLADAVLVGTSLAGSGDLERALREIAP